MTMEEARQYLEINRSEFKELDCKRPEVEGLKLENLEEQKEKESDANLVRRLRQTLVAQQQLLMQ